MTDESSAKVVADYLERVAPAQSHEDRRHFQNVAGFLRGIDISEGDVTVVFPVWHKGAQLGMAQVLICEHDYAVGGKPGVYADFLPHADGEVQQQ